MRSTLKRRLGIGFAWAALLILRMTARRAGIAVVYHRVGYQHQDVDQNLVPAIGATLFDGQVRHLARAYRVVPGSRLLTAVADRRRGQRFPVAITFDDDAPWHNEIVRPILAGRGVTATFFISGASLIGPHEFWWDLLQRAWNCSPETSFRAPLLTALCSDIDPHAPRAIHLTADRIKGLSTADRAELNRQLLEVIGASPTDAGMRGCDVRDLAAAGCEIGFHTLRHEALTALDDEMLERAMRDGREPIEEILGRPLTTVAYPHGHGDERVARAAAAAGFTSGFTGRGVAVQPDDDPLLLGRVGPSNESVGDLAFRLVRALVRGQR